MVVEDIKVTLPELLDSLTPGDEVIVTRYAFTDRG
jgi:hypothetical protein